MPVYVFKITFTNNLLYLNICATTVRCHYAYAVTNWPSKVTQICKMNATVGAKTIVIKERYLYDSSSQIAVPHNAVNSCNMGSSPIVT